MRSRALQGGGADGRMGAGKHPGGQNVETPSNGQASNDHVMLPGK